MPFLGRSYYPFVLGEGLVALALFVVVARVTRASRRAVTAALVAGAGAAAVNLVLDTLLHHAGWLRYREATTPFGPLGYYVFGIWGWGMLALVVAALAARFGQAAAVVAVGVFGAYGPVIDYAIARRTHLVAFHGGVAGVLAESLSERVVPLVIAVALLAALEPSRRLRPPASLRS